MTMYDNTQHLLEIYNPAKRVFLDTKFNMRDVKYCENIVHDNSNYIKPMFCQFLSDYAGKKGLGYVKSIVLLHNYKIVEDFVTRYENQEQMKELYRWNRS
jgi:hypothetical protein